MKAASSRGSQPEPTPKLEWNYSLVRGSNLLMTFSKTLPSSPSPLLVLFYSSVSLLTWLVFVLRS